LKSAIEVGVGDAIPKVRDVGMVRKERRTRIAVHIRDTVNGDVAALSGVERGAADAEWSLLERGGGCEANEKGEENC